MTQAPRFDPHLGLLSVCNFSACEPSVGFLPPPKDHADCWTRYAKWPLGVNERVHCNELAFHRGYTPHSGSTTTLITNHKMISEVR